MNSSKFARCRARIGLISVKASLVLVLLQLPLSSCLAEAQVSADKPDVEWPGLTLGDFSADSIEEWRDALSEPWTLGGESITFSVGSGNDRRSVGSCGELFAATNLNPRTTGGPDRAIVKAWLANCRAIQILVGGISPATSFIEDFGLDEASVKALPVGTAFVVSRDDKAKVEAIKSKGGTLGDMLGGATITPVANSEGNAVQIRDSKTGKARFLSLLAEGDFDHDGFDDVLLYAGGSMIGGTFSASNLYIVSRVQNNGPLVLRSQL